MHCVKNIFQWEEKWNTTETCFESTICRADEHANGGYRSAISTFIVIYKLLTLPLGLNYNVYSKLLRQTVQEHAADYDSDHFVLKPI